MFHLVSVLFFLFHSTAFSSSISSALFSQYPPPLLPAKYRHYCCSIIAPHTCVRVWMSVTLLETVHRECVDAQSIYSYFQINSISMMIAFFPAFRSSCLSLRCVCVCVHLAAIIPLSSQIDFNWRHFFFRVRHLSPIECGAWRAEASDYSAGDTLRSHDIDYSIATWTHVNWLFVQYFGRSIDSNDWWIRHLNNCRAFFSVRLSLEWAAVAKHCQFFFHFSSFVLNALHSNRLIWNRFDANTVDSKSSRARTGCNWFVTMTRASHDRWLVCKFVLGTVIIFKLLINCKVNECTNWLRRRVPTT